MAAKRKILYPKRSFVAVVGDDDDFWLCRTTRHVYEGDKCFDVQWLEETDEGIYSILQQHNSVEIVSVICATAVKQVAGQRFMLSAKSKRAIETAMENLAESGIEDDGESSVSEVTRKRGRAKDEEEDKEEEEEPVVKATKDNKGKKKSAAKPKKPRGGARAKKGPAKAKKAPPAPKGPKGPKPPNWKLKPNPDVLLWEKDPLFESKEDHPYVSSTVESKLAIRAVLTKDLALLKKCVSDREKVHSLTVKRSMAVEKNALHYAIQKENMAAMKILAAPDKSKIPRVIAPTCMLPVVGTGKYNFRSLGIKKIRRLNMSRGGREGNNALTKDVNDMYAENEDDIGSKLMEWNSPVSIVNEAIALKLVEKFQVTQATVQAVRFGHAEVAAHFMEKDVKQNAMGSPFSHYHHEALVRGNQQWQGPIREVSARKKGVRGITPMHCAAINPNTNALEQLFAVCPDVNVADDDHRKLVHYAAVAKSLAPIKFLVENGANLEDVDKEGVTPLMVACVAGRPELVEYIIKTVNEKRGGDVPESILAKMGAGGVNKPARNSFSALHFAVSEGHLDVVKILVKYGVNVEKQLNVFHEKRSPLMMAAANADLPMVKFLVDHAKVEKYDRYKRGALTHAVMNGAANVVSFLLRLGADPNKADTSGNTNLHYACAYGWYFCMRSLLSAGADLNAPNEWKLTPVAVALLKGQTGIAKFLLDQPGVDINFKDDQGKTVLLKMVSEADVAERPLTAELLQEITDMVERRGADAKIADNDGLNALHYLGKYKHVPAESEEEESSKDYKARWLKSKLAYENFVDFFVKAGCSTMIADARGYLPVMYAMEEGSFNDMKRKNYGVINTLLKAMSDELKTGSPKLTLKPNQPSILNSFTSSISLVHIEEETEVLKSLTSILRSMKGRQLLSPSWEAFVEAKTAADRLSPLMALCRSYSQEGGYHKSKLVHCKFFDVLYKGIVWDKEFEMVGLDTKWAKFRELIQYFIETFNPMLSYKVLPADNGNKSKKELQPDTMSAVVILANVPNEPKADRGEAFKMLLALDKNVDVTDHKGQTALVRAIKKGRDEEARRLVEAGANIDHVYQTEERLKLEDEEEVLLKSCPLIDAAERGNLEIVRLLIHQKVDICMQQCFTESKNGDKHNRSLFRTAAESCMRDRRNKAKLAILRELIGAGADVNVQDKQTRRNALHLTVNNSTDQADQSLDLEIVLLRSGCNAFVKDFRQRLPLHYAFVKIGGHKNSDRIDPIEVCSMLVESMKGNKATIDAKDEFGSTPLHYAAYRGATVSCLFLLEKGADINAVDSKGNTPLAYAVLGQHEGCALILLQKGTNVNVNVHPYADVTAEEAENEQQLGRFNFVQEHFEEKRESKSYSLFQGAIQNNWLGITYVALQQLEAFGMSYAKAVEVAFHMQKIQFAKTLIGKQVSVEKLLDTVENGRNLLSCLAYECKNTTATDIQEDVVELLVNSGLSLTAKDADRSSPLHYACRNSNNILVKYMMSQASVLPTLEDTNKFGLTPLAALFWNFQTSDRFLTLACLKSLLDKGANPDVLFHAKPLSYLQSNFTPSAKAKQDFYQTAAARITPLIVAIVHRKADIIQALLAHKENGADLNLADETGITPLMHAVRTNDIDIVLQLFAKGGEPPSADEKTKQLNNPKVYSDLDLDVVDKDGYNVIRHLIQLDSEEEKRVTFDNVRMLELLVKAGLDLAGIRDKQNLVDMAVEVGAISVAKKLGELFRLSVGSPPKFQAPEVRECVSWNSEFEYDVVADAKVMLRKLELQAAKEEEEKKLNGIHDIIDMEIDEEEKKSEDEDDDDEKDSDDSEESEDDEDEKHPSKANKDKPRGCIATDGDIYMDYSILMTKIDVSFGAWGLYNFYRMQIWKEKHKDLWILFTNWGRIGGYDSGQFQNTPYGSAEQAVEEFEKIFKAKSGNEWKDKEHFENKPKRYRLVKTEHLQHVKKTALKFDLESAVPSKLPEDVQEMVIDLANVSMYIEAYKEIGSDIDAVPFGRIKREVVEQAKKLLDELRPLIKDIEKLEESRHKTPSEEKHAMLFDTLEEVSRLSSEYYHLMPKQGFEYTRLSPIDKQHLWDEEMNRVNYTMEFEVAERLLLGAQLRKNEINPLDYIYRAIGCTVEPMRADGEEVPHILQYMYNSRGARELRVEAIFKVKRTEEDENFGKFIKGGDLNRKLLWHGTKTANLMSILDKGLLVNAPYAPVTGKAFGNGLYTSDIFDKSSNYTFDWRSSKYSGSRYMLLCDVALGKAKEVRTFSWGETPSYPGKGNHSVVALGSNVPDSVHSVKTPSGLEVPLGGIVPHPLTGARNFSPPVQYNEYVTFDKSQTAIRYIVKIHNPSVKKELKRLKKGPWRVETRGPRIVKTK